MAKWSANVPTWTPLAVADATNFTDAGYMALQGGSTTQAIKVYEIFLGGQAPTTSSPCIILVARDSVVGVSALTGARVAALDPATAALAAPPLSFNASTTKPQRSATLSLLNLSFNAFGSQVMWKAAPDGELKVLGNTQPFGELSISAFTGGTPGLTGSHMLFEPA
jgi:hypothetical protein